MKSKKYYNSVDMANQMEFQHVKVLVQVPIGAEAHHILKGWYGIVVDKDFDKSLLIIDWHYGKDGLAKQKKCRLHSVKIKLPVKT